MTFPIRILTGLWLFTLVACKPGEAVLSSKAANRFFMGKNAPAALVWRQHASHDPYLDGITTLADPALPTCLVFYPDGVFHQDNGLQVQQGQWFIHSEKKTMALQYNAEARANGAVKGEHTPEFRYQIARTLQDTLVLKVQGRHGWVSYTYVREPESLNSSPLPD